jgi:hypothetical protein
MRRAVLAALLALGLSSVTALVVEARGAPTDYLPDDAAMPAGFVREGEDIATPDSVDRFYFTDRGAMLRLVAVRRETEGEALETCHTRSTTLASGGWAVRPAVLEGRQGFVGSHAQGLQVEEAAFMVAGSACVGLIAAGVPGTIPTEGAVAILREMAARAS